MAVCQELARCMSVYRRVPAWRTCRIGFQLDKKAVVLAAPYRHAGLRPRFAGLLCPCVPIGPGWENPVRPCVLLALVGEIASPPPGHRWLPHICDGHFHPAGMVCITCNASDENCMQNATDMSTVKGSLGLLNESKHIRPSTCAAPGYASRACSLHSAQS